MQKFCLVDNNRPDKMVKGIADIDIEKMKLKFGDNNVKVGCVGACRKVKYGYFGKINGVYVSVNNEDEFIKECVR